MTQDSRRPRRAVLVGAVVLAVVLVAAAAFAWRSEDPAESATPWPSGPPVGDPVLPDLSPQPPIDVHTKKAKSGDWIIEFSSTLVNVGKDDFLLRGHRDGGTWSVEQDIPHSSSGVEATPIAAKMVWGGDGHDHWHIGRVATYRLLRLDREGRVASGDRGRVDSKIGFCFFDFHQELARGPDEAVHSRHSCGEQDDDEVRMGLSPGWGDTYEWNLPGQSIGIEDLADGSYRLRAEADEAGMFRETTRDNNVTWVDLDLTTRADGARTALVVAVGPEPR